MEEQPNIVTALELEVLAGPDSGKRFFVRDSVVVGRAEDAGLVLSDPMVSSYHLRISLDPAPTLLDLQSANGSFLNERMIETAGLKDGDVIGLGGTHLLVRLHEDTTGTEQAVSRPFILRAAIVALLLALVSGFGYLIYARQDARKREAVLGYRELTGEVEYPRDLVLRFPKSPDFMIPPTNSVVDLPNYWGKSRDRPKSREQLAITTVLPPNPYGNQGTLKYFEFGKDRDWSLLPPRMASGRFINSDQGSHLVLGTYRSAAYEYFNGDIGNQPPPEYAGKEKYPALHLRLTLESWDGLPRGAGISYFAFDELSKDPSFAAKRYGIVPRQTWWSVPREKREFADDNLELVSFFVGSNYYVMKQVRVGESLYTITVNMPRWQRDRLEKCARSLLEAQTIPGYSRGSSRMDLVNLAVRLDHEADELLPIWTEGPPSKEDFDRIERKGLLFRAFNRYIQALILMQVTDNWGEGRDPEYARVFDKAARIYTYVQSGDSYFQLAYGTIERNILMNRGDRKLAVEAANKLFAVVLSGQEPEEPYEFMPDEWFVYALKRQRELNRKPDGRK